MSAVHYIVYPILTTLSYFEAFSGVCEILLGHTKERSLKKNRSIESLKIKRQSSFYDIVSK